jgi:Ca-activated chloride channel homolog
MTVIRTGKRFNLFSALVGALMLGASGPVVAAEIKLDAELGQSILEANKSQSVYLRLNLKTLAGVKERQRAPINVALVLDRSGSMQGARIVAAKEAARMALARLNRDDTLSVVMFNNLVDVLQPAGRVGERTEYVREKISAIKAEGGTAIYAGVSEGAAQVRRNLNPRLVNRVILMSDGQANVGPSSPRELGELGREIASKGVSVTTIGLGDAYNEDLMQRLASASDGNHAFAKEPEDLLKFFNAEFGDAMSIAAQDITITIEVNANFKAKRVLSRDAEINGQKINVRLNNLQSDNERYVVIELENSSGLAEGKSAIADVNVDYVDIDTGQRAQTRASVEARVSASASEAAASVNKPVAAQAAAQIATEETKRAVEMRDKGDVAGAKRKLEDNAQFLKSAKERYSLGSASAPAATGRSISDLDELEAKSAAAAKNLEGDKWEAQRKGLRHDQSKIGGQNKY